MLTSAVFGNVGGLMLIAWMLAESTGALMAGFFKPDWPEQTLFGQKIWFQVGGFNSTFFSMHIYASVKLF